MPRQSILRALWRRRWLVLISIVGCTVAGVVYLHKTIPIYTSSSRLLVEQTGPKVIATSDGMVAQPKNYLYTQCELLKSTPILSGAVKLLGPRTPGTFDDTGDRVAFLKENVQASVGKADDIITVWLESPYPEEAAQIVNAIVESYVAYQSSQQRDTAAEILKILQREKVRRDAELRTCFGAAMAFKRDNEIISFGTDNSNVIVQRLDMLSNAVTQAELALMEAKARFESTQILLADPRRALHLRGQLFASQGTTSPGTDTLDEERNRLNMDLTVMRQTCTEDHPAVRTIKLKLKQLDEQEKKRVEEMAQAHLGWLKQQVATADSRRKELTNTLDAQRKLAQQLNSKSVQYAILEGERKRAERICDILDSRIKEINITEDAGALNISLLETARPADLPSKPNRAQAMSVALALGLILGIGLAIIGEWVDHRLRSVGEVSAALGLPVLGIVPRISGRKKLTRVARVMDGEPNSHAAEAYRTIRTAVYFGAPDIETKTLVVTSPAPSDGKTALVGNLAVAMARAGQKVIVLDADFRKPSQHDIFAVGKGALGVTEVLVGGGAPDDAIVRTDIDGLDLLACGKIPPNASEILNSQAFGGLLTELSARYDRVLIDAPPVLGLADARILGARCDAALMVLRADKSSRKPSKQAVQSLLSVGTRILGIVINDVPGRRHGYGYGDYGYCYPYGYASRRLDSSTNDPQEVRDMSLTDVA